MPPNEKISDLSAAAPLVLSDHILVARGSAPPNFKATIQAVLALGGGVGGGGTINKIPIWVSPGVLGNSALSQSGASLIFTQVESGNLSLLVRNSNGISAVSNALLRVSTAGASSGDPIIDWLVSGEQQYMMGIDNSEDDKFVGSVGTSLGAANWLEVTTARGITLDAASGQTVALAVNSVEELQVSGTAVIIPTNNLIVDGGNIGITAQTNLIAMASNRLTVNGDLSLNSSGGTTDLTMEGIEVIRAASGAIIIGAVATGATTVAIRASGGNAILIDVSKNVEIPNDLRVTTGDVEITGGMLGIGNPPTLPLDVNAKAGITDIGGIAIKLTNKSGANTVAGHLVSASSSIANAFDIAVSNSDEVIGIVYEPGVADGSEAWVVVSGFAMVRVDGGGAALNNRLVSSATAGISTVNNSPTTAVHFQEVGHAVEAIGGAGLVKTAVHFN